MSQKSRNFEEKSPNYIGVNIGSVSVNVVSLDKDNIIRSFKESHKGNPQKIPSACLVLCQRDCTSVNRNPQNHDPSPQQINNSKT